ncbi:hypothetical protein [Spirosoma agri]|uniref:DUF3575 domain-containing protein n=1 Tax=Spirosoma agri TaxID=1987381 RepID=A0A6M0IR94_9BACT|nr:hypothetical protein [Spirosoma agri]NEU70849.1 hypothetical protein [Spirosoma agri]
MAPVKWLLSRLTSAFALAFLVGCRVTVPQGSLDPDFYRISHSSRPDSLQQKVYVLDTGDSLQLLNPLNDQRRFVQRSTFQPWTFQRAEIDVDVFTLPFKIRPAQAALPAQLNSNFNAALYLGRRIDLYNYRWKTISPTYAVRQLQSRGFGYGLFAGIGAVAINDFVTRIPLTIEYEGVVLNAGVAAIYDARIFNIGLAVGLDHLLDKNRQHWIYQHRPWFGVLFGLNLN